VHGIDHQTRYLSAKRHGQSGLGRALYFSRAPIPYSRKITSHNDRLGFGHIGLYAYTRSALLKFAALSPSFLEQQEGLEQLRALDNGMSIEMVEMASDHLSIDTQADYEQAKQRLEKR
jgi:3-deoxy-manno-octulosonate cytidylyltransferase (CMP-KDO synthetase)